MCTTPILQVDCADRHEHAAHNSESKSRTFYKTVFRALRTKHKNVRPDCGASHDRCDEWNEDIKRKAEPHAAAGSTNTSIVAILHRTKWYRIYARRVQCRKLVLCLFWSHRRMNHVGASSENTKRLLERIYVRVYYKLVSICVALALPHWRRILDNYDAKRPSSAFSCLVAPDVPASPTVECGKVFGEMPLRPRHFERSQDFEPC